MSIEVITKAFKELGHPVRLAIYKFVMRAGAQGAPVGKVCDNIKIPNSVISLLRQKVLSNAYFTLLKPILTRNSGWIILHCLSEYHFRIDFN